MIDYDFFVEDNTQTGNPIVTVQAHYWVNEWRQWRIHGKTAIALEKKLVLAEVAISDRDALWAEWDRILVDYDGAPNE